MNTKYIIKYVWGNQEDMIKYVWEAHNFEIKNLWQCSILLVPLIVMAFTAMGILQLKIIDDIDKSKNEMIFLYAEFFVCSAGVFLSLFWVALAKASKFIQEAHEEHLKGYLKKCSISYKKAYCDLNKFEKILKRAKRLYFLCPLKAYRFSPSKINIALGWLSMCIFVCVFIFNCAICLFPLDSCYFIGALIFIIALIIIVSLLLFLFCKGGKETKDTHNQQNALKNEQNTLENKSNHKDCFMLKWRIAEGDDTKNTRIVCSNEKIESISKDRARSVYQDESDHIICEWLDTKEFSAKCVLSSSNGDPRGISNDLHFELNSGNHIINISIADGDKSMTDA